MSEWQPIETAPKDGTTIVALYPIFKPGNDGAVPDGFSVMTCYHDNLGWDTGYWRLHQQPQYWLPLPAMPAPRSILDVLKATG